MTEYRIINADCMDAMREMDDCSIDAIVTDPPYGLAFMGAKWDSFGGSTGNQTVTERQSEGKRYADENKGAPRYGNSHGKPPTLGEMRQFQSAMAPVMEEALRVAKPGAHLLCFGGTRTFHRMACAIEDAGWEIRDCVMWTYGCLSEDSEILTPSGWARCGEIGIGDEVVCYDIRTHAFGVERAQATYLYEYDDTAYRIESDATDQLVSRNHRVIVERDGVQEFVLAEQVAQELEACVPVLEDMRRTATLARVTPTHYKGKMWCVKVPSGAFVARRNGKAFVTGNSGFPKSMNVSKAIDKMRKDDPRPICRFLRSAIDASEYDVKSVAEHFGFNPRMIEHWAARDTDSQPAVPTIDQWEKLKKLLGFNDSMDAEVIRLNERKGQFGDDYKNAKVVGEHKSTTPGLVGHRFEARDSLIREPNSEAAAQWDGWGTCLKPAWEPIIVARKPLDGTVAHNVMTHGVGAMNIDGCRIPTDDKLGGGMRAGGAEGVWDRPFMHDEKSQAAFVERKKANVAKSESLGRFPANLVHDGSEEVLALFPDSRGQQGDVTGNEPSHPADGVCYGEYNGRHSFAKRGDSGSAARFFYCAKASKKDRGEGNVHPTCKPTALMEWLVRLVTPRGGVVLDPFCGSGTTGVACVRKGMHFIGIEREEQYAEIARRRIDGAAAEDRQLSLF